MKWIWNHFCTWFKKKPSKESYGAVVLDDDLLVRPRKREEPEKVGVANTQTSGGTFAKMYDQVLDELCKIDHLI